MKYQFPQAALRGQSIIDVASFLPPFNSVCSKFPTSPESLEACREVRDHLVSLAVRFPKGVAPRDLPLHEADLLLTAVSVAAMAEGGKLEVHKP